MGEEGGIRFLRIQNRAGGPDSGKEQSRGSSRLALRPPAAMCVLIRTSQEGSLVQSTGIGPGREEGKE